MNNDGSQKLMQRKKQKKGNWYVYSGKQMPSFLQNKPDSDQDEESDNQLSLGSEGMPVSWKWSCQAQIGTQIAY